VALRLGTALRVALSSYDKDTFKKDFIAGLIVSLIALPLSMALSIAVGLPPQHGLYTAIVAGIVAAVFGGSNYQVTGPTAAFVVIVAPIVAEHGLHGLIWCQIIAGVILLLLGILRLGGLIRYVPYPVVTGFTAGIAVTIATLALNDFFGLGLTELKGHYIEKVTALLSALPYFRWQEVLVGAISLGVIFGLPHVTKKIPAGFAGIVAGTVASFALSAAGVKTDTILSRFSYTDTTGAVQKGIPPYPPVLHLPGDGTSLFAVPSYDEFLTLLMPALLVAALAALETLLSATVADSIAQDKHNSDAELNGLGLANIFSGLAAGIPATGAIARTSANIHSGAKTPVAAIIHGILLLAYMMTLAPVLGHMPMAALAALLISVAWRMSHAKQCIAIARHGTRAEAVVLFGTLIPTILIDMVAGVSAGMILAALLLHRGQDSETPVSP
jgi:SulP family sulfate permease